MQAKEREIDEAISPVLVLPEGTCFNDAMPKISRDGVMIFKYGNGYKGFAWTEIDVMETEQQEVNRNFSCYSKLAGLDQEDLLRSHNF